MKRRIDKIWLVGILFLLAHCFSFESTEEKELKQMEKKSVVEAGVLSFQPAKGFR